MIIEIFGAKCIGIEAIPVRVEVDINHGLGVHLVGLADVAVKESLLRTMTALRSVGYRVPGKKIVINLAPADLHKSGSGYDLPIALGIIAASGQISLPGLRKFIIMGELGLDGTVRKVNGALSIVELAIKEGFEGCILPKESAAEAADYQNIKIYGVDNLTDVITILSEDGDTGQFIVSPIGFDQYGQENKGEIMDYCEIIGLEGAKRGMEIAAAGGHNVILIGSPGCGKSSLAKATAGILPAMSLEEALTTRKIYSVSGMEWKPNTRPFRSPHHSASLASLIGGGNGNNVFPGEISLAQGGILFLDEFTQFPKSITEALRGPLEDRKVTISRLKSKVEYPASFMLIAASNPCPCGYYGEGDRCSCTSSQKINYLSKLSGPILDRIDIQLWLKSVNASDIVAAQKRTHNSKPQNSKGKTSIQTSAEIAKRVIEAREIQKERFREEGIFTNAEMNNRQMNRYCPLDEDCKKLLEFQITRLGLSTRSYTRIIKLARTIADLSGELKIIPAHIAEAISYRILDKQNLILP